MSIARRGRSFLYEVPLFYLALFAALRALFPNGKGFLDLNPSPCWLGILLFGLRYGLPAGLLSGIASAAITVQGFRMAGESYRFDDLDFYVAPGLFIVFGAAIGGVTDRFLHRMASLLSKIDDLTGRNRGLLEQLQAQQKAQRAIEQQVVSQMSSIVTLYHGARDLGHLDRAALMNGILDFFTKALQATKTAYYVPDGGRWVLRDQRGWEDNDVYPRSLDFTQGMVGRAGAEKRVVSLRDWFGPEMEAVQASGAGNAGADAIMAGPLLDEAGDVRAVFGVQAMPFLKFNSASVSLLTLLLDWGGEALIKCGHFEELRAKSILDEEFGVYNEQYFRSRARQEFDRSRRYALPFSILLASLQGLREAPLDRQVMLLHALSRLLREKARDIDIVTKSPFPDAPFAVLMMTASREQADSLRTSLLDGYGRLGLPHPLQVGIGSFKHSMENVEALVEQARQGLG